MIDTYIYNRDICNRQIYITDRYMRYICLKCKIINMGLLDKHVLLFQTRIKCLINANWNYCIRSEDH